jgi:hypothetical protein
LPLLPPGPPGPLREVEWEGEKEEEEEEGDASLSLKESQDVRLQPVLAMVVQVVLRCGG